MPLRVRLYRDVGVAAPEFYLNGVIVQSTLSQKAIDSEPGRSPGETNLVTDPKLAALAKAELERAEKIYPPIVTNQTAWTLAKSRMEQARGGKGFWLLAFKRGHDQSETTAWVAMSLSGTVGRLNKPLMDVPINAAFIDYAPVVAAANRLVASTGLAWGEPMQVERQETPLSRHRHVVIYQTPDPELESLGFRIIYVNEDGTAWVCPR